MLSPAGALLLLLGLGLQAVPWGGVNSSFMMTSAGRGASTTRASFGLPPAVHLTWDDAGDGSSVTRSLRVDWHIAGLVLLVLYLGAAAVGRAVTPPGRPWRPVRVLLTVVACVGVVAFAAGAGLSRYYWGYFFSPSAPDRRIVNARRIVSFTPFWTEPRADGSSKLVIAPSAAADDPGRWMLDEALGARQGSDEYPRSRVIRALYRKGLRPGEAPPLTPDRLEPLYGRMLASGAIDERHNGCPNAIALEGVVIGAAGPWGEPLLLASVGGDAVGNDHFAHYEFLFADAPGAPPSQSPPLSVMRYYYDVAGMEGMNWWNVALAVGILGLLLAVPVALLAMSVLRFRDRQRADVPGFPITPA